MSFHAKSLVAVATLGLAALGLAAFAAAPAQALTSQECSAKYKQAKEAGTLNGQKWNDFRKAQCGSDATAAAPAAPTAPAAPAAEAKPAKESKSAAKEEAAPAAAPSGPAVFPTAVDQKYAKEKPGTARMHTCVDQYNANKATNANGGLKWIQKGGGYFSECTKKLKGAA
ncbi:hypothetical protein [Bradyrhizobium sp. SRS-191]|uniref:hypothetical protein n=1 Tax=Bradyrhizobium sp. SRS-191 TaxID=2962606 RepID=UPI00211E47BC|nr:hypothetical protein [Bradyrhizobium sp. SRS-191]